MMSKEELRQLISQLPVEYQPIGFAGAEISVDVLRVGADLLATVSAAAEKIFSMEAATKAVAEANATMMYCQLQTALREQLQHAGPMTTPGVRGLLQRQLEDVERTIREIAASHVEQRDRELARMAAAESITQAALGHDRKKQPSESTPE